MQSSFRLIAVVAAFCCTSFADSTLAPSGAILLNGRPFPMVLDAGTDCFTPQDYDTVMASKDAWGANTWWLQYSMLHMRSEREGDFTGLARELDFFERTGMMANLYVRGEYRDVPEWFYKKYDDYRMQDPAGKPVGGQICFQHEGFRHLIDGYVRGVARAARDKKALLMYSTYDEFGPRGWGCFCPRCVRKYREYLKAKFGDVMALNGAWGTKYAGWEDVDAPRTQSFDANYGEWQRYRLSVLRDFGLLYYNALKQEDPRHLRWIDINMDLFDYTWRWGVIWWKLTDIFDMLNNGPEGYDVNAPIRTAMSRAITDNYGKGGTWHLGFPRNEVLPRGELYSRLFDHSHGGLVWWYSFWDVLRGGRAWGGGEEEGSPVVGNWFRARELNHLARYLGDLYVHSKPVRGKVGLFVSGTTDLMRSLSAKQVLQKGDPTELSGMAQILRDLNIAYEAIGEDQLSNLGSFQTVVLGQFSMCGDEKTAAAFREYVRGGGNLIVLNGAFSADVNGREAANPAFGLEDVWGSAGAVADQMPDGRIAAGGGIEVPSLGGVARRKMGGAHAIGSLPDGTPAVTVNKFGKGRVLFFGTNAGEAYNAGYLLTRGQYFLPRGQKLDLAKYAELVRLYRGWQGYAALVRDFLREAGVTSPVRAVAAGEPDLFGKVRVSVQEQKTLGRETVNHLLVVTLEPVYDPEAQIKTGAAKYGPRSVKDLALRVRLPAAEQVKAVYRVPPVGYEMGKMDAVPGRVPFTAEGDEIRLTLAAPTEAECLLVARDARPLVGVKSDAVSAKDGQATPLTVTVDNATGWPISGEITFPAGFRVVAAQGSAAKFASLKPGERYAARFEVTAPTPIDRHRTFAATVRYRGAGGEGEATSYPVTSRTDERIAWSWLQKAEAGMTDVTITPGIPRGRPYAEVLQKREFAYAAYNDGAWADAVRLARELVMTCNQLKAQRREPGPPR